MKVLWFTSTSAYKQDSSSHHYYGAGWISSLEQLMTLQSEIDLAVCFFHAEDNGKLKQGNTTYYPIRKTKVSKLKKLYNNWKVRIEAASEVDKFIEVIEDFKPDVIQIFGTEASFAAIQARTTIPVIIHVQGIINPYLNAWFPPGINNRDVFFKGSTISDIIKANGNWFARKQFIKRSERESAYFPFAKYLMGRTEWDKNVSTLLMPSAKYFVVNEVLRPVFYEGKVWVAHKRTEARIFSNISSSIYKGLDQVLKTAAILKNNTRNKFKWLICGIAANDPLIKLMERKFHLKFEENNIEFLGTLPGEKLIGQLLESDVYVHPSYIENSPNSICEAQLLGVPVIGCYVGGIPTLIENNKTGILVPANDPYTMAASINHFITDKSRALQIGSNARVVAQKRHDRKQIVSAIINVYRSVVPENLVTPNIQLKANHDNSQV